MNEDDKRMTTGEVDRATDEAEMAQNKPLTSVVGICSVCGKGITQSDLMTGRAGISTTGKLTHFLGCQ